MTIAQIIQKYKNRLDYLDLELLIASSLSKTREFVLIHPEHELAKSQISNLKSQIERRIKGKPIAYLTGHKEFYGLDFVVNKYTLIPRPETEQMVELVLDESKVKSLPASEAGQKSKVTIVDVGTGSGCIIISIAHELEDDTKYKIQNTRYFGIDTSPEALKVAKKNAKNHGVNKKIKFVESNLLSVFIQDTKYKIQNTKNIIITANLPYLSKEIYNSAPIDVKKFEPKSALYSAKAGLAHYHKLLLQIKTLLVTCHLSHVTCLMEISPEQKQPFTKLIKSIFPAVKIEFKKDLASKWRICKIVF